MDLKIKIRLLFFGILLLAVFYLLYKAIVPLGRIVYIQDFTGDNYFIPKISPDSRAKISGGKTRISGDPVYFSLRSPRTFNEARVTYEFRTNIDKAVIETGPLADKTIWRYQLKPIYNGVINDLVRAGEIIFQDKILFWQREKQYNTLEDFLSTLPSAGEIALYHYDWPKVFYLPDYATSSAETVVNYPLKGAYEIYTYIKEETLDLDFQFSDLNQNQDKDQIDLFLTYNGELIDSRRLAEKSNEEDGQVRRRGDLQFKIPGLPEGLYKLELRANGDIVTTEIRTAQSKLAFVNKLELLRDKGQNIRMYTDSQSIQAATVHPDRLQTVQIGSTSLELKEIYRQHRLAVRSGSGGIAELVLEQDGITISGNGVWAFGREALVNPALKKADKDLDIENINYLLAEYDIPADGGQWLSGSQTFDLSFAYREDGAYQFIISIPGLRADDEIDDWVEIREIKVELKGRGLMEKIYNLF